MEYPLDIRQSEPWSKYLNFLGWQTFRTSSGINFQVMQSKLGNVVKVQRPKNVTSKDLQEIEDRAEELGLALIKVEPDVKQGLEVFKEGGYVEGASPLSPPATIFINLLDSKEKLYEDLSGSCKYSIRRARREGAQVEFFKDPSEEVLNRFYKIHKSTGKQKSFYIQSYEDISKKIEAFGDQAILGMVSSLIGEEGKREVTGTNLYLGFKDCVWYMHGGTTKAGRKTKNGYELYWQSILHLKKEGYRLLDLEGVDDKRFPTFTKDWGGLSHFKEKFGGTRVEFPPPYVKYLKPWLKKMSKFFKLPI